MLDVNKGFVQSAETTWRKSHSEFVPLCPLRRWASSSSSWWCSSWTALAAWRRCACTRTWRPSSRRRRSRGTCGSRTTPASQSQESQSWRDLQLESEVRLGWWRFCWTQMAHCVNAAGTANINTSPVLPDGRFHRQTWLELAKFGPFWWILIFIFQCVRLNIILTCPVLFGDFGQIWPNFNPALVIWIFMDLAALIGHYSARRT